MRTRMLPWTASLLAQIDEGYDRERPQDPSRYGVYLDQNQDQLRGFDGEPATPVQFAVGAWRIAAPPTMSPSYLRFRPDLDAINARASDDDPDLLLLTVVAPLDLSRLAVGSLLRTSGWQDWRAAPGHRGEEFPPVDEPADHCRAVLTLTEIRVPVYARDLPVPGAFGRDGQLRDAQASVAALVRIVNATAGPAVADINLRFGARL